VLDDWVVALTASPLIYVALYLFATIDGFFPPIPSESVVIGLAAMSVATGAPNIWIILAVAAAGAFTGDQIAYAIGRRAHVRRSRLFRRPRAQRTLDWAEHALATRGAAFIVGARYIPVGRVAVNMTAGAVGFPYLRFLGLTALAAVSWAIYSAAIGIGAGAWLHDRPVVAVIVGVVGGTLIGLGVDAVLSRVQGRPGVRHLGTEPAGTEPATVPADGEPAGGTSVGEEPGGPGPSPMDVAVRHDVLVDIVLRDDLDHEGLLDGVLVGGELLDGDLLADDLLDDHLLGSDLLDPDGEAECDAPAGGRADGPVGAPARGGRERAAAVVPGADCP
jgi:membrane-associated protein